MHAHSVVGSHTCSSCSALVVDMASQSKYCLLVINCQSNICNFYMYVFNE